MFAHCSIYVKSLEDSKEFYEKVMSSLGHKLSFGEEENFWAFESADGTLFEILQRKDETPICFCCHVAFRAKDREQVDQFYKTSIEAGGICNGPPGPRPQYTKNYYAAYIYDPDGHNIEAVHDF